MTTYAMSEWFDLPFKDNGYNSFVTDNYDQTKAAIYAINSHDPLTAKVAKLKAELEFHKSMYNSLNSEKCYWKNMTVDLNKEKSKLKAALCEISDMCIGNSTMSYLIDADYVGQLIYAATGMTNPELSESVKESNNG
jgi:hypothetical protein